MKTIRSAVLLALVAVGLACGVTAVAMILASSLPFSVVLIALAASLGVALDDVVRVRQVHGRNVLVVREGEVIEPPAEAVRTLPKTE